MKEEDKNCNILLTRPTIYPISPTENRKSITPKAIKELYKKYGAINQVKSFCDSKALEDFIRSYPIQIISALCTLYTLFFPSIIQATLIPKKFDDICSAFTLFVAILILAETIISFFAKSDYPMSWLFFIDTLCAISMIYDIHWIFVDNTIGIMQDFGYTVRIIRALLCFKIIRYCQLNTLTKKYEQSEKDQQKIQEEEAKKKIKENRSEATSIKRLMTDKTSPMKPGESPKVSLTLNASARKSKIAKQSLVARSIQGRTIMHSFIIIIPALIISRIFLFENYAPQPNDISITDLNFIEYAQSLNYDKMTIKPYCDSIVNSYKNNEYPLIFIGSQLCIYTDNSTLPEDLRDSEKIITKTQSCEAVFDKRSYRQICGILNFFRIVFAIIVLVIVTMWGSHYNRIHITIPMEIMIEKVQILNTHPMAFINEDFSDLGVYHHLGNEANPENSHEQNKDTKSKPMQTQEIQFLENAFNKIARLLAVVYGEAGSEMITSNTIDRERVSPVIPGHKIYGIYGFIKITEFEEVTNIMQERVLLFTNTVAEIIHSTVEKYFGMTNKNIGESFFVLWKVNRDEAEINENDELVKNRASSLLADLALLTGIKILAKINKLTHITTIKSDIERSTGKKISLLIGFNAGWGIEGPIGSDHKIDASYLSPNVNIAARTESVCAQYGVQLLVTGQFYRLLSTQAKSLLRKVDVVAVKGSKLPVKLYTIDLNYDSLVPKSYKHELTNRDERKRMRVQSRKILEHMIETDPTVTHVLYAKDIDLKEMRKDISLDFLAKFKEGCKKYIKGEWKDAALLLNEAQRLNSNDETCKVLLKYMSGFNFVKPDNWAGFRALSQK